jgi:hypothetical protein
MAVLSDNDRAAITAEFMSAISSARETVGAVTKADLRAAFNALDAFMDTNAAAINTAIPQPARGVLTTAQKARILVFVIQRRFITGS